MSQTQSTRAATLPRGLNITLWVLQWLLGLGLIAGGVMKLAVPGMITWAVDAPALLYITAVLDVLGGLGVLLPSLTRIAPRTTVVAALAVVALMLSATAFYLLRGEPSEIVTNLALAVVAGIVAWGRWRGAPIPIALPVPAAVTDPLPAATPPAEMTIEQLPTGTYATRAAMAVTGGSFGDERHFAATAVLIRHPKGDILIDAGFGADIEKHVKALPSFARAPYELTATVSDQFDAAGYDRSRLLGVLITHSHWDHVSGLDGLDVPIWVTSDELQYAAKDGDGKVFQLVAPGHEIHEYSFDGPAYLGFPASFDLYGDGSVVVVPASGHTTGSVVVFVTLPAGTRYAFIGDLTWQLDGITKRVQRPLMLRMLADSDAEEVRQGLLRMIALADRVQVVPAHATDGYHGIPLFPAASR
jgi:N-acyl homoserine lactone hydrolase